MHTGSFSNQAVKHSNPGPVLSRARTSGIAIGKGVRNLALGMKSQRQPLCNTADGLRQCEDMIRFLSDLYTSIAGLSARNGVNSGTFMSSTIKGTQNWPESFLEGMRYQLRRMLTHLLDRLSPTTSSARLKVSILV